MHGDHEFSKHLKHKHPVSVTCRMTVCIHLLVIKLPK